MSCAGLSWWDKKGGSMKHLSKVMKELNYKQLVIFIIMTLMFTICYNSILHIFLIKDVVSKENSVPFSLPIILVLYGSFFHAKRINKKYFPKEIFLGTILSPIISFIGNVPVKGVVFIDRIIILFITRNATKQEKLFSLFNKSQYFYYHGVKISYIITGFVSLTSFVLLLFFFFKDKSNPKQVVHGR